MIINNLMLVKYLSRPNRFTVEFENEKGKHELAHLHDPGRLKELLIKNTDILIKYVPTYKKTGRKTRYDVIGIKYEEEWVLLNSSYHNKLVEELINKKQINEIKDFSLYKPEYTYENSRFDFLLKNNNNTKMFLEVKGCTLVDKTLAKFPDAPTVRGKKHVDELINIRNKGMLSTVVILILQNKAKEFSPNYDTDIEFSNSLEKAYENDVLILPVHINTMYKNNSLMLKYDKILPLNIKSLFKEIHK